VSASGCGQNGGRSTGLGDSVQDSTAWLAEDQYSDDLGNHVPVPAAVHRLVSLVPSLTETVASLDPGLLAGATDWCTHPAELGVSRIGGTKNPQIDKIIELAPDVVLANEEENREPDLEALRAAGLAVWVTRITDLPGALRSLRRMVTLACRQPGPAWLDAAEHAWRRLPAGLAGAAVVPIWRRPWMVVGSDTFAGDLLARLGVTNIYAGHSDRYPRVGIDELRAAGADLVVLPDEPYRFTASDGPEAFPGSRTALVSGRHLTWYGPSLVEAPFVLGRQLGAARVR
jgi:ABC-type Fe3+-hydroxamate transport system substrate-binding protein